MTDDPRDLARSAVTEWLNSPAHLHNIRGNFTTSGIGVWENADGTVYFTQIFVRLAPAPAQTDNARLEPSRTLRCTYCGAGALVPGAVAAGVD